MSPKLLNFQHNQEVLTNIADNQDLLKLRCVIKSFEYLVYGYEIETIAQLSQERDLNKCISPSNDCY